MSRLVILLALAMLLAGCSAGGANPTETPTVVVEAVTDSPTANPTASPTVSPSPTATATATATPSPTPTPTPSPTPTPTATPTPSPTPTPTPTPTATPRADVVLDGQHEYIGSDDEHVTWEFWGTVTNQDTRPVTIEIYLKIYTDDSCDPTFTDDPTYTVQLNPGESWDSPEKWRFSMNRNYDLVDWTLLPMREGC